MIPSHASLPLPVIAAALIRDRAWLIATRRNHAAKASPADVLALFEKAARQMNEPITHGGYRG